MSAKDELHLHQAQARQILAAIDAGRFPRRWSTGRLRPRWRGDSDAWRRSDVDPGRALDRLPGLRLRPGFALRAYECAGIRVVFPVPVDAHDLDPHSLGSTGFPRHPSALEDVMDAVAGDDTLPAYACASLFVEQITKPTQDQRFGGVTVPAPQIQLPPGAPAVSVQLAGDAVHVRFRVRTHAPSDVLGRDGTDVTRRILDTYVRGCYRATRSQEADT
ncbi:MAG: hypothetical protein ACT4PP_05545 [Sporichthyaceae bacterium]